MTLESTNRIKAVVAAVDTKTGAKNLSLRAAVQILCDGYTGAAAASAEAVSSQGGEVVLESADRLRSILNAANAKTGHTDSTITAAAQRLCNGYAEPAKLYSFGLLSDLHIQYETGVADLQRALTYLKDRVAFTCVPGDLVSYATEEHMAAYKACVDGYAGGMPVYESAGNHESYPAQGVGGDTDATLWNTYTGKALFYSFAQGDDVFIMLGLKSERANDLFPAGALDWLETTLEANKSKRCFVFQHAPELADRGADPSGTWASIMDGTSGQAFVALMKQYPNVVWFHGHTHVTLGVEQYPVSDQEVLGYRSVHVPSLVSPRFYDEEAGTLTDYYFEGANKVWGSTLSEGYIVDVYENKIILRGINFAAGANKDQVEPMTEEVYALDTTLATVG